MAQARAKAKEAGDEGVRECLNLMASGRWISGVSHLHVAERRKVHPGTAMNWATAAGRVLRLAVEGDTEDLRSRMVATLGAIIDTAMNTDLKAAISAIDTQAKLLGLMVQKHEVKSDLSTLTDEQIEQRAKALVAKLGKKA